MDANKESCASSSVAATRAAHASNAKTRKWNYWWVRGSRPVSDRTGFTGGTTRGEDRRPSAG